jgi:hypothetical protein
MVLCVYTHINTYQIARIKWVWFLVCQIRIWRPVNSIPVDILKGNETICLHKNLCSKAHNSISHNSQRVETIQMPIQWWMNKSNVICPYNRILFSHKKKWSTGTCCNMDEPWRIMLSKKKKKPDTKWASTVLYHLYISNIYRYRRYMQWLPMAWDGGGCWREVKSHWWKVWAFFFIHCTKLWDLLWHFYTCILCTSVIFSLHHPFLSPFFLLLVLSLPQVVPLLLSCLF